MYELICVGAGSYYIQSPTRIGVYVRENGEAFLIDGGSDPDAAKKAKKHLDQQGWRLCGVLVTHGHADHVGGCAWLQRQTGCKIFAAGVERAMAQWTRLNPSLLWGSSIFPELEHKFLLAQPSEVLELSNPDFPQEVQPIDLHGHSFHMTGYRTPDGTVFLGDSVSSERTLEKYQLTFLYDVQEFLDTLNRLEQLQAPMFVGAHIEPTADIVPLVRKNREKVHEIAAAILQLCREPITFEELLRQIFAHFGITMNPQQFVLIGSTVRAYLSWLNTHQKLTFRFEDNRMLWQTV